MKREKKTWLLIKRGLVKEPKHREAIGNKIWLYMHIIDRADWETGKVFDWRDKDEADDMGMSWRTLQSQRQELESLGYIECKQEEDRQTITITKWVNPRSYSGEVLNTGVGYEKSRTGGTGQGTHQGTNTSYRDSSTPTYNSRIKNQEPIAPDVISSIFTAYENNIGLLTPMISESIQDDLKEYPTEWFMDAIKESASNGKRNLKYIQAILRNWKQNGYKAQRVSPEPKATKVYL